MGVEGESYRVRCADLFPPPSEGSIITALASKIANLCDDAETSTIAP